MNRGAALAVAKMQSKAAPAMAARLQLRPEFLMRIRLTMTSMLKLAVADSVATAVAAVSVLRNRAVFAAVMVAFSIEVIRMTTGAVRLERWA